MYIGIAQVPKVLSSGVIVPKSKEASREKHAILLFSTTTDTADSQGRVYATITSIRH